MTNEELQHPVSFEDTLAITPYFFVYGTLKRPYGNHVCLHGTPMECEAISAEPLFNMSCVGFPYLFENGKSYVKGEIYEVNSHDVFSSLDGLEGYPWHYTRKVHSFRSLSSPGYTYRAWVYINPDDDDYSEKFSRRIIQPNEENILDWTSPRYRGAA